MYVEISRQIFSFLIIGGPVVWILTLMSVIMLAVLLVKLWQFGQAGLFSSGPRRRSKQVIKNWESGAKELAHKEANAGRDPLSFVLSSATSHLLHGTLSGELLQDELSRQAQERVRSLRSNLRVLELIATLAPLLGLLGTVLGMIEAFQAMELAGKQVDPSTLSGGIWKALLTTAVGLVVAVPAIVIHNWLEARVEIFTDGLTDSVAHLLTLAGKNSGDGGVPPLRDPASA